MADKGKVFEELQDLISDQVKVRQMCYACLPLMQHVDIHVCSIPDPQPILHKLLSNERLVIFILLLSLSVI